jgi:urease accessory protein
MRSCAVTSCASQRCWPPCGHKLAELPMFDAVPSYDFLDDPRPPGLSVGCQRNPSDKDLQRANGVGRVVLGSFGGGTRIKDLFQRSPIRIMFPGSGVGTLEEAVLINTAGGIAGGDRLEYGITALANASIAVTSQAAEKVYRALDEPSRITTKSRSRPDRSCSRSSGLYWVVPPTARKSLADAS